MSRLVGKLGRALYVGVSAVVVAIIMSALWLAMLIVRRRPRTAIALQHVASRMILACLGCRYVVRGAPLDAHGGARLLVANHTSYLDIPLMLAALKLDFVFVTKSELLAWPVISLITRAGAHIPVTRERVESRGAVVARIVKTLRAGRSVLVFPEGTFSHDDRLRSFHRGAFHAAVAAGCPVVPIATRGVGEVWSQHAPFPRPGRIQLMVGEPILTSLDSAADAAAPPAGDPAARVDAALTLAERFISAHSGLPTSASSTNPHRIP